MAIENPQWGVREVADYLNLSPSHVRARVVTQRDFPPASYVTTRRCNPRWSSDEVREWATVTRRQVA